MCCLCSEVLPSLPREPTRTERRCGFIVSEREVRSKTTLEESSFVLEVHAIAYIPNYLLLLLKLFNFWQDSYWNYLTYFWLIIGII